MAAVLTVEPRAFGMLQRREPSVPRLPYAPGRPPERLCAPRRPGASHIGCLDSRQARDALLSEIQELPEKFRA